MSTTNSRQPQKRGLGNVNLHPLRYLFTGIGALIFGIMMTAVDKSLAESSGSGVYVSFYGLTIAGGILALAGVFGLFNGWDRRHPQQPPQA